MLLAMLEGASWWTMPLAWFMSVEHQKHLNTHETLEAIKSFEWMCLDNGVVPMEYIS